MSVQTVVLKNLYELNEALYEGLISYTFRATHLQTQQPLIIYGYKADYLTPKLIRRLIKQANRLISIQHKHIAPLLDYIYEGDMFYTVHDLDTSYTTLEEFMLSTPPLDAQQLWKIATHVLSALLVLEKHGLVYGNLNLESIWITPELDVKIAKIDISLAIIKSNFDTFDVIEECIFYPPEFLLTTQYNTRSDVYSFGVLLYFLLSGRWPYTYTSHLDELRQHLLTPLKPFLKQFSTIPDRLVNIIYGCLQKDPDKRFPSFSDLVRYYKKETDSFVFQTEGFEDSDIQKAMKNRVAKDKFKHWGVWGASIALVIACFVMLSGGFMVYQSYLTKTPNVLVPNTKGVPYEEGVQMLFDQGLSVELAGSRFHAAIPKGSIVETKPPSGRYVKKKRKVRVFLSKGPIHFLVPSLKGRHLDQVSVMLNKRLDKLEIVEEIYSATYPENYVVEQLTTPNTYITSSQNIQIVLSKGFPVKMDVRKATSFFFIEKPRLRKVSLEFFLLDDWDNQDIKIVNVLDGSSDILYQKTHKASDFVQQEFELPFKSTVEFYVNDELTFEGDVEDTPQGTPFPEELINNEPTSNPN